MKRKSFNRGGLSFIFMHRIHGNEPDYVLELKRPNSESARSKNVIENILRWEDDGGPVFETGDPLPQPAEINTPRLMDAAGDDLLYDEL